MAATYTMDQYAALIEALAVGALRVQYGSRDVQYRSQDDMLFLKGEMERDLGLKSDKHRTSLISFRKQS